MGFSYRKRKGPLTFSASRRGPRVSIGFGGGKGCLLPVALLVFVAAVLLFAG